MVRITGVQQNEMVPTAAAADFSSGLLRSLRVSVLRRSFLGFGLLSFMLTYLHSAGLDRWCAFEANETRVQRDRANDRRQIAAVNLLQL